VDGAAGRRQRCFRRCISNKIIYISYLNHKSKVLPEHAAAATMAPAKPADSLLAGMAISLPALPDFPVRPCASGVFFFMRPGHGATAQPVHVDPVD
jgi:hypothetical protein